MMMSVAVSTPNIGPLQTLDQDLRRQQITLPDPTNMVKWHPFTLEMHNTNIPKIFPRTTFVFPIEQSLRAYTYITHILHLHCP